MRAELDRWDKTAWVSLAALATAFVAPAPTPVRVAAVAVCAAVTAGWMVHTHRQLRRRIRILEAMLAAMEAAGGYDQLPAQQQQDWADRMEREGDGEGR